MRRISVLRNVLSSFDTLSVYTRRARSFDYFGVRVVLIYEVL